MINLHTEPGLTVGRAAKQKQLQRNGKFPNACTVHRWMTKGIRGIVLESVIVGGTRITTSAAIDRWVARLSGQAPQDQPTPRLSAMQQGEHERAEQELAAAGWL